MDEHTGTGTGGVSSDAPPPVRRLTRRLDRKVVAGVAGGIADHFSIDPLAVRLGFVVLTLLGGVGVIAYLLAWWLVPPSTGTAQVPGGQEPWTERLIAWVKGLPSWVGMALLILGFVVVGEGIDLGSGIVWGLALVALGVVVFRHDSRAVAQPARPGGGTAAMPDASPTAAAVAPSVAASAGSIAKTMAPPPPGSDAETMPLPPEPADASPWAASPPAAPARPVRIKAPRERSALGWVTFGAALAAVGVAAFLEQTDAIGLRPDQIAATGLAVLGIGLVVGAWIGRARWLILIGLLVLPFLFAASLIDVPLRGGFGDRSYHLGTTQEIAPAYHMVAGRMTFDLSDLPADPAATVVATLVAGEIVILVPTGYPLDLHAKVGAGTIDLFGQVRGGFGIELDQTFGSPSLAAAAIHLDVEASFGQVTVRHVSTDQSLALPPPSSAGGST